MKTPLVLAGWIVTVAAAFAAGRTSADGAPTTETPADTGETARLERQVEDLTRKLADERSRRPRVDAARARSHDGTSPESDASQTDSAAPPGDPATETAVPADAFTLEGVATAGEASKRLMTFVEAQLARGEPGQAAILDALNVIWRDKATIEALFSDEAAATREIYPWIRMLVQREAQVVDVCEYAFRTMAEKPDAFAATPDSNALEIFTEGFAFILPGVVSEERLARLRGYAQKILATPEAQQPKALRGNRSEIERLLSRYWPEPLTPEQALEKLRAGDVSARDLVRLLRLAPSEALAGLDVTSLVAPHVRHGSFEVIRNLGTPPLDRLDVARLDQAMIEAMDAGTANSPHLSSYVQRSGRREWTQVRPFFDLAFARSERAANVAAQVLASSMPQSMRPDRAYVEDVLRRVKVDDAAQKQLRAAYGIQ